MVLPSAGTGRWVGNWVRRWAYTLPRVSRIIAGRAGGRRLRTPSGSLTRPTTDRVREAVFSALAAWNGTADQPAAEQLGGQAFLDLFAGSGAVGLEAASRGAGPVVCVEQAAQARRVITGNRASTGCRVEVVGQSVGTFLAGRTGAEDPQATAHPREPGAGDRPGSAPDRFDVVWFDPPYDLDDAELDRLVALAAEAALAGDGLLVVERSSRSRPPAFPEGMTRWTSRYGETAVHYAQADREEQP